MKSETEENIKSTDKRNLTSQEKLTITHLNKKRTEPVKIFRVSEDDEKTLELAFDKNLEFDQAKDLFDSYITQSTGMLNSVVGLQLLSNLGKAIVQSKTKGQDLVDQLNTLVQAMQSFAPQDEYEGQLIAQLVILHEHAMDWLGRAMRTERVNFANIYLNGASKLLTRHHETLEALLKYRRRGEQRVHVEHVHVHRGGQAIVGNVMTGSGMNHNVEEDPHAKV